MGTLTFTNQPYQAVICLNGTLPTANTLSLVGSSPFIAADGALGKLIELDIYPEYVVGDFDSVEKSHFDAIKDISEVVHESDQDSTDFEKCLKFAAGQLYTRLLIVGIHGGDLEHTLNNWSILMRYGKTMDLTLLDRERIAVPLYSSTSLHIAEHETVSLIPQPLAMISTSGLFWELTNEELSLLNKGGARNVSTKNIVQLDIHTGSLLCFMDSRLPLSPTLTHHTSQ